MKYNREDVYFAYISVRINNLCIYKTSRTLASFIKDENKYKLVCRFENVNYLSQLDYGVSDNENDTVHVSNIIPLNNITNRNNKKIGRWAMDFQLMKANILIKLKKI